MAKTKPYYQGRGVTIFCGNCREINGVHGDHVICDPPYDKTTHKGARYGFTAKTSEIAFPPVSPQWVVPTILAMSTRWTLAFCSLEMLGKYKRFAGDQWVRSGFWRRTNGVPQFTGDRPAQPGEGIAIMHAPGKKRWNGHGRHAFWAFPIVSNGPHPTTKPLDLMSALIADFTDPGDVVVDPFMGSGTTLVAAQQMGRQAIGIELDERYCEVAVRRLKGERVASRHTEPIKGKPWYDRT